MHRNEFNFIKENKIKVFKMRDLFGRIDEVCDDIMELSQQWDGFCEYYYQRHQTNSRWPDGQFWPNMDANQIWPESVYQQKSTGNQLLMNTAEKKYCTYDNCVTKYEPFNRMDPNSILISYRENPEFGQRCFPRCKVDPATIEDDIVMDHCLKNPMAAAPVLINICNTSKRDGVDLSGTKLGAFCERYEKGMSQLENYQSIRPCW